MRKILFVRQPRLAKVNLVIDHSREKMQAARIDNLVGGRLDRHVEGNDFPRTQENSHLRLALRGHYDCILDQRTAFHFNSSNPYIYSSGYGRIDYS